MKILLTILVLVLSGCCASPPQRPDSTYEKEIRRIENERYLCE
jgi:starvation-inducible outer membrane lipoprotein